MAREPIGKKLRFEVFKRDKFTCQYCGAKAPEVVLHCDHMQPVADGGETTLMNLITSCIDCNLGKGARLLADDSVVERQRAQIAELEERRQQLEMMLEWRNGLQDLAEDNATAIAAYFCRAVGWSSLNDFGNGQVKDWLKKHGAADLLWAVDESVRVYAKNGDDGKPTKEGARKAFHMVPRIAARRGLVEDKPHMKDVFYIRGILRNIHGEKAMEYWVIREIEAAYEKGVDLEWMKAQAKKSYSVSGFLKWIAED